MKQCKVVIPIYTNKLSDYELLSLKHNTDILKSHPIALVAPDNLNIDNITDQLSNKNIEITRVSEEYLGIRNGISGYNRLMLISSFYDLFTDYEYILICQLDVWIFKDELKKWCDKGFDCIGGIWWRKGIWALPVLRYFFISNRRLYGKVGNGGLSLRKVDSFSKACKSYIHIINRYNKKTHHMYGEDVFWAIEPKEFKYPSMTEATEFSFDSHPDRCYELIKKELPFGCHGWFKPCRINFWKRFIPIDNI